MTNILLQSFISGKVKQIFVACRIHVQLNELLLLKKNSRLSNKTVRLA